MQKFLLLPAMIIVLLSLLMCSKRQRDNDNTAGQANMTAMPDSSTISIAAELYYNSNQYNAALVEYEKLTKIDPSNGLYLFRKAYCLTQLDSPLLAISFYEKASEINYRKFDCLYSIGINALMLDNDSMAIRYFEKCLLIKPNSAEVKSFLKELKPSNHNTTL